MAIGLGKLTVCLTKLKAVSFAPRTHRLLACGAAGFRETPKSAHTHYDAIGCQCITGRSLQVGNCFVEISLRTQLVSARGG